MAGFFGSVQAQFFWNTDFEYGVYKSQPRKWAIEGEGYKYSAHLDSTISKSGKKSLFMRLDRAQVYTILTVPGKISAGNILRVQGYTKAGVSDSLNAQLILFNPSEGGIIASESIKMTSNKWNPTTLRASIPANYNADNLLIALMASGSGSFWFDNVRIKINDTVYGNDAPDFREPDKEEIELLNNKVYPFSVGAGDDARTKLKELSKIVENKRIVALGENSHGSASIYKLKLRMIQHLVEDKQFSVFALEMPAVEATYINEYVKNETDDLDEVITKLSYPSWQSREMLDIIEWIRVYNNQHNRQVSFMGYDMQNGWSALGAIAEFSTRYDSTLHSILKNIEGLYQTALETGNAAPALFTQTREASTYLNTHKYPDVTPHQLATIRHFMDIFNQSISLQFGTENARSRDEYMAKNIRWIIEHIPDTAKIILSADNTHITKSGGKTGAFLDRWYQDDYLSFGFTFEEGTYAAYGNKPFYEVHPSYVGTYEYLFSKSDYDHFFLDLREADDIPMLNQPAGFRAIGSRPQETTQFYQIQLKKHFDVIVYLRTSRHTSPLNK